MWFLKLQFLLIIIENSCVTRYYVIILIFFRYLTFKVINQEIARSRENKTVTSNKPKIQKKEKSKKSKIVYLLSVQIN